MLSARSILSSNFLITLISVIRALNFRRTAVWREIRCRKVFRFRNFAVPNLKLRRKRKPKHRFLSKNRRQSPSKRNITRAAVWQMPMLIGRFVQRRRITRRRIAEIIRLELGFPGGEVTAEITIWRQPKISKALPMQAASTFWKLILNRQIRRAHIMFRLLLRCRTLIGRRLQARQICLCIRRRFMSVLKRPEILCEKAKILLLNQSLPTLTVT